MILTHPVPSGHSLEPYSKSSQDQGETQHLTVPVHGRSVGGCRAESFGGSSPVRHLHSSPVSTMVVGTVSVEAEETLSLAVVVVGDGASSWS